MPELSVNDILAPKLDAKKLDSKYLVAGKAPLVQATLKEINDNPLWIAQRRVYYVVIGSWTCRISYQGPDPSGDLAMLKGIIEDELREGI
tara:strand:- start:225 stop:494 length:270 start_codon:yes stop_codon:yes gene_type:complete